MSNDSLETEKLGAEDLVNFLVWAFHKKESILIKGRPGVGKTSIGNQVAEILGCDIIFGHPAIQDPTDYRGLGMIEDGKAKFFPYDTLEMLIDATEPCIYFIDDLGQAPMSIQKALMQILYDRKLNGKKISDNVVFFAATNNRQDKAGVSGLIEPLKSRFTSIIGYEPSIKDFEKWWLQQPDLDIMPLAFTKFRPNLLTEFVPTNDITNSPCPRTIAALGRLASMNAGISETVKSAAYSGAVGFGFAMEYMAFEAKAKQLVNLDSVLNNPSAAAIPDQPDIIYAAMHGLAKRATRQNIGNIVTYVERVESTGFAEFSMICMEQIRDTKTNVVNTSAFAEWSAKHSELYE